MTSSDKHWQAFQGLLSDVDELLRLPRRVAALCEHRPLTTFCGFAELLDTALPTDSAALGKVARAVRLTPDTLARLRAGHLNPTGVAPEALTRLGRALALDGTQFLQLVALDHDRFEGQSHGAVMRGLGGADAMAMDGASLDALRDSWERMALDDPRVVSDDATRAI